MNLQSEWFSQLKQFHCAWHVSVVITILSRCNTVCIIIVAKPHFIKITSKFFDMGKGESNLFATDVHWVT